MKSSFKLRLLRWFIIVSIIPSIFIGTFSYFILTKEIENDTEKLVTSINQGIYNMIDTQHRVLNQWLISAADSFENKMEYLGSNIFAYDEMIQVGEYYLPTWYMGNQKITLDYTLVDELIGTERLPASIFMLVDTEFVRVSTNVRKIDGSRIISTTLDKDGPVYQRLINGQEYLGRANVEGILHTTLYSPIFDEHKKMIGAYVLGRKEQEYEVINAIKRISIGEEGYVMIIDTKGDVIIHPELTGNNVLEYDWIKKIIRKQDGYIEFSYEGEDKIAYFKYFEPWDWYIISIGYYNDIYSSSITLSRTLLFIITFAFLISLFIAITISKEFFKPIHQMMESLRKLKNGDLSSRFTSREDEEFKFLSNTFNSMSYTLSLLIGRIKATSSKLKESSERLLNDFNRSKNSLNNIESIAEGFLLNKNICEQDIGLLEIKATISNLKELAISIEENDNLELDITEMIRELACKVNSLDNYIINNTSNKEVNALFIEIQKLKLLLENIYSSATSLDEIAYEVDSQVNQFKIENDPYDDD